MVVFRPTVSRNVAKPIGSHVQSAESSEQLPARISFHPYAQKCVICDVQKKTYQRPACFRALLSWRKQVCPCSLTGVYVQIFPNAS